MSVTRAAWGTDKDLEGEPKRTAAEARADALVAVSQFFLDNQSAKPGGRHRPHSNVLMDVSVTQAEPEL